MVAIAIAFVLPQGANAQVQEHTIIDEETVNVLSAIENMPDNIIYSGREERKKWIEEYTGLDLPSEQSKSITYTVQAQASWGKVATCAGALGTAAVINLTPDKIVKLKSALKAAGGAKTFVTKCSSAYKTFRNAGACSWIFE